MKQTLLLMLGLFLALTACQKEDAKPANPLPRTGMAAYDDPEEQRNFKLVLEKEGIPFETTKYSDGAEVVKWSAEYDEKVKQVQIRLEGEQPPINRSVCMHDKAVKEFKEWLHEEKIPYQIMIYRKQECVVWSEADHTRVEKSKHIPEHIKDYLFRGAG